MKLRNWQEQCANLAINHFENIDNHFLCLATPGAGKTIMAAEVASRLLKKKLIDLVLCFSPSNTVCKSLENTLGNYLDRQFDGVIGSVGSSLTYQSMQHLDSKFWSILIHNRVFVIFDEIHHCQGETILDANVWGAQIIQNIADKSAYSLALTGTPWRSNKTPIVLSRYFSEKNRIRCDYIYGLEQAIQDLVCRKPKIVLTDNEKISVTTKHDKSNTYSSFQALLKESSVTYSEILHNEVALKDILTRACLTLNRIRKSNQRAGGLVVASSVAHAKQIQSILTKELRQDSVRVSYHDSNANKIIDDFKTSDTSWIISIGMISEGTDIPRLQVCCHLSRVKTELYFRQVLGRILRVNNDINQEAWLFTFAEEMLSIYANRIEAELPQKNIVVRERLDNPTDLIPSDMHELNENTVDRGSKLESSHIDLSDHELVDNTLSTSQEISLPLTLSRWDDSIEMLGVFREQIIETFESPF